MKLSEIKNAKPKAKDYLLSDGYSIVVKKRSNLTTCKV